MLFKYKTIEGTGQVKEGVIDAVNIDIAINSLQRRGMVVSAINPAEKTSFFARFSIFAGVSTREIVILSRQMATLFQAQVSALRVFRLLSEQVENVVLRRILEEVSNDIQGGSSISKALSKHPKVFADFYVNMVIAGEESGKLDQTFEYLAEYLDRTYELTSKAKNALVYPAFVIFTFVAVMVLMLTLVIPRISEILIESGQSIPIYTQIVIWISNFFVNYGVFFFVLVIIGGYFLFRFSQTPAGKISFSRFKISVPYIGDLYRKLYLSRIADNMNTMILSGVSMVRVMEVTSTVVDNEIYRNLLTDAVNAVKAGSSVSDSLAKGGAEIPAMMVQMIKVGEETGELGNILKTLARFYQREVSTAVDTLVDLIEPVMIVALGLGVGFLLASVLIPIYNISSAI